VFSRKIEVKFFSLPKKKKNGKMENVSVKKISLSFSIRIKGKGFFWLEKKEEKKNSLLLHQSIIFGNNCIRIFFGSFFVSKENLLFVEGKTC
jgi:hypothetical protein